LNCEDGKKEAKKESSSDSVSPSGGDLGGAPSIIEDMLRDAPAEVKKAVIQMGVFRSSGMPTIHPLFDKFKDEHISKLIEYGHKDDENDYRLRSSNRWFQLATLVILVSFLAFLIIYLATDNKELLVDILKILVVFAGGFGSGFGYKAYTDKKKSA
jgi:hypothetical protein